MHFNKVVIAGYLTRDLDLRFTPKGTAVAQSAVAINRKWRDDSGQEKDEVCFADFTAWGKTAETMAQYLRKGAPVLIEGRLKQDTWEDKQTGQKRSKLAIVVETFQFLEPAVGKREGEERRKPDKSDVAVEQSADDVGDSIPF